MSRSLWQDEGTDVDLALVARNEFRRVYCSARDPRTPASVQTLHAHGLEAGIYRVPEWDGQMTGAQWADLLSKDVARIVGGDGRGLGFQLAVLPDIETHDTAWIADFLKRWRAVRPSRETWLTIEGHQGGMLAPIRDAILKAKVGLMPQAYDANMNPFDSYGCVMDLQDWGFTCPVVPMYGANHLLAWWTGAVFRSGMLG